MSSQVAEIASMARYISSQKFAETQKSVSIEGVKREIDMQVMIQQQMVAMMQQIQPHLGSNVNVSA